MQNAAFEALGLNWRYLAFEVVPAELGPALAGAAVIGGNVLLFPLDAAINAA